MQWLYLIAVLAVVLLSKADDERRTRTDILTLLKEIPLDRTPPNYDSDEPTVIECVLDVHNVDSIREADMDFSVQVGLHLSWKNYDLISQIRTIAYEFEYLDFDATNMEKVWVPDIYFPNEKKATMHNIMMSNKMLRLYKDGTVRYIVRASVTLSCRMNLRKYPFDKQICSIMMESFGYTVDKLVLFWAADEPNPVATQQESKELRQFRMVNLEYSNYTREHNITGNHSCLQADFHLVRNIGFYVIQMYVPSLLIVVLSWLSFWLNVNSIPGRITLGVLSVLTISTQSSSVNASLPRVSYTKAIDVWMATCLVFAFAALIEFAVVNVLSQKLPGRRFSLAALFQVPMETEEKERDMSSTSVKDVFKEVKETTVDQEGRVTVESSRPSRPPVKTTLLWSEYLDMASRFMFPLAFAIFNSVYWIYYLNVTEY